MKLRLKLFLGIVYISFVILFLYLYKNYRIDVGLVEIIFFIITLLIMVNISLFFNYMKGITTSINLPVILPAMALIGPFWTGIVALVGTIKFRSKNQPRWYKFAFNRTMFFMAAGGGALVFKQANLCFDSNYNILPFLLATITYFIINNGLVWTVVRIASASKEEAPKLRFFIEISKDVIFSYFLGLIFYFSYVKVGKVLFVMAIVLIFVIKDFLYSRLQQLNSYTQIVESFLKVIDSKDHYTEGHCERVANYTYSLCQAMDLNKRKTEKIVNMAKIHDIGKIYIDDEILKSSDYLSDAEYAEMKKHSAYGYDILKDIDLLKAKIDIIKHHHERYDGMGYPEGIKGKDIPLGARILCICDAFDVMTTGRSYKPAMNKKEVIKELKDCSGGQFDPVIVSTMINLVEQGKFDDSFIDLSETSKEESAAI